MERKTVKTVLTPALVGSGNKNSSEGLENDPTYDQKCNSRLVGIVNSGILRKTRASERQQRDYGQLESK
jgi:hypothetical protein